MDIIKIKRILNVSLLSLSCLFLCSCNKSDEAIAVDEMIEAIGEVALDSESKIIEAENAVANLSEEDVKHLDNLSVLTDARNTYDDLNSFTCDLCGEVYPLDKCIETWRGEKVCRSCRGKGCKVCGHPLIEGQIHYVSGYHFCSEECVEQACGTIIEPEFCEICGAEVYTGVNQYFHDEYKILCKDCFDKVWKNAYEATLKDEQILNSNGKHIWRIYPRKDEIHFNATYRGTGNFIMKLLNGNQDLVELICNEIGDYDVNKTVDGLESGHPYFLEIHFNDGSYSSSWTGTYGQ